MFFDYNLFLFFVRIWRTHKATGGQLLKVNKKTSKSILKQTASQWRNQLWWEMMIYLTDTNIQGVTAISWEVTKKKTHSFTVKKGINYFTWDISLSLKITVFYWTNLFSKNKMSQKSSNSFIKGLWVTQISRSIEVIAIKIEEVWSSQTKVLMKWLIDLWLAGKSECRLRNNEKSCFIF